MFFHFILGSLATYRLALMVSKEDGPAWIFRKLRNAPPRKSSIRQGIRCEWCVSIWASALVTAFLLWLGALPASQWPLWWLGMSAAAILLNQKFTKD